MHLPSRRADAIAAVLSDGLAATPHPGSEVFARSSPAGNDGGAISAGLYDEAICQAEAATRRAPRDVEAWLGLGELALEAGHFGRALTCFQRALELCPERVEAWVGQSAAQNDLARPLHALALTDEALARDSESAAAWYQRGRSLHRLGRLPSAVEAFERVIELEPSHMRAWKLRGICQRGVRRVRCEMGIRPVRVPRLAIASHTSTAEDFASHWGVSVAVAALAIDASRQVEQGDFVAAIERLGEATDLDPAFAWGWRARARCQQFMRRFDEAIDGHARAFELEGKAEDLEGLGHCQLAAGKLDDALATFARAIAQCPTLADAWHGRSLAFEAAGNRAAALAAYDRFVELAAANASTRADRAHARDLEARRRLAAKPAF